MALVAVPIDPDQLPFFITQIHSTALSHFIHIDLIRSFARKLSIQLEPAIGSRLKGHGTGAAACTLSSSSDQLPLNSSNPFHFADPDASIRT